MTTSLQPHLDSISSTSSSISSLAFNTIPTHFISSLLHQSGVDNLIRDPHPHERGLFTVRPPREKENIPLNGDSDSKVLRTRSEKPGITPLLLAKYSAGGNVEADVFLNSVNRLLEVYPVAGVKERIEGMLSRHGELLEDVNKLEGLVEEQKRELEMQNSSRLGGFYDDDDGGVVTQTMVDEEEDKVRELEEKIKGMQDQIARLDGRLASV